MVSYSDYLLSNLDVAGCCIAFALSSLGVAFFFFFFFMYAYFLFIKSCVGICFVHSPSLFVVLVDIHINS